MSRTKAGIPQASLMSTASWSIFSPANSTEPLPSGFMYPTLRTRFESASVSPRVTKVFPSLCRVEVMKRFFTGRNYSTIEWPKQRDSGIDRQRSSAENIPVSGRIQRHGVLHPSRAAVQPGPYRRERTVLPVRRAGRGVHSPSRPAPLPRPSGRRDPALRRRRFVVPARVLRTRSGLPVDGTRAQARPPPLGGARLCAGPAHPSAGSLGVHRRLHHLDRLEYPAHHGKRRRYGEAVRSTHPARLHLFAHLPPAGTARRRRGTP